jgi:hypothetical protein
VINREEFLISRDDIIHALNRLGELAKARNLSESPIVFAIKIHEMPIVIGFAESFLKKLLATHLEIILGLVGGAVMVVEYNARENTHDIDAIILAPAQRWKVLELVRIIAKEYGWPEDWLNDNAEQFIDELRSHSLFIALGIEVHVPAAAQMLALKLSAWRSEVDFNDVTFLLKQMSGSRKEIWRAVKPFLVRGCEATAEDAFNDCWNNLYGYD